MKRITVLGLVVSTIALAIYGAITLYDDNLSVGRMWQTPTVRAYEEPILIMASGLVPTTGGEIRFRTTPGEDLVSSLGTPAPPTAITAGKRLYARYCQQCHGVNHDGQGTVGQSFAPLPNDLRSTKVQVTPEGVLFKEISYGVPNGRQPALATTIEATDRWRIVAYVKSLGIRN